MKQIKAVIIATTLFAVAFTLPASAQQCGPGCPACSGKTVGDLLPQKTLSGSLLYIPGSEEETAVYSLRYGLFSWLDAGIGYAQDTEEVIWSIRTQPVEQDLVGWLPGVVIGTGSIQTGGSDQSVYLQLLKSWEVVEGKFSFSLTGGLATDLPGFAETWKLGTVSVSLFDRISPFYTYDGLNPHAGVSIYVTEWLTMTGYALEMEELAVMTGVQWAFGEK
jgi:hypothetical protein